MDLPRVPGRRPPAPPLEYLAFRELRQDLYLRYAHARTGDSAAARRAVDAAFAELAERWPEFLRSAQPAALAWSLLVRHVTAETAADGVPPTGGASQARARRRADARLLHQQFGLPLRHVAGVMGTDPASLAVLLRS